MATDEGDPGIQGNPAAFLLSFRLRGVRQAASDPFLGVTVLALTAAVFRLGGNLTGVWGASMASPMGVGIGFSLLLGALLSRILGAHLLFRAGENSLLLTLPLSEEALFQVRRGEIRAWGGVPALVGGGMAAGMAGGWAGVAAGLAALWGGLGMGLWGASLGKQRRLVGWVITLLPGGAMALISWRVFLPFSHLLLGVLAVGVGLGMEAPARRRYIRWGREGAQAQAAAGELARPFRRFRAFLVFLPEKVAVRVARDLALVLSGGAPRAVATALLAASLLPFAASALENPSLVGQERLWHLEFFRWLAAGVAVLSFGWGVDLMDARTPGLLLERTVPERAGPTLWAAAVMVGVPVAVFGTALLGVAPPGPLPVWRLGWEIACFSGCFGHLAAAFSLSRWNGAKVSGAFSFLPVALLGTVGLGLLLLFHPAAVLVWPILGVASLHQQARSAFEAAEMVR